MRTAYYIATHHKFEQFRWLFEAIYQPGDVYAIHVDRKSRADFHKRVLEHIGTRPNVVLLPRISVAWGGWSQIGAELAAIRELLKFAPDWKYFINLSGQDYPLKPLAHIKETLRREWPRNVIRVWSFDRVRKAEPQDPHLKQRLFFEFRGRVVRTPLRLPYTGSLDLKFKGSQWHMLTREFCEWLDHSPVVKRIARRLKFSEIPDETFFQAALMNSPFREQRTSDHYRTILWPGPKILGMEDYPGMTQSDHLFGRKFDESVDRAVLERLAADNGYRVPQR